MTQRLTISYADLDNTATAYQPSPSTLDARVWSKSTLNLTSLNNSVPTAASAPQPALAPVEIDQMIFKKTKGDVMLPFLPPSVQHKLHSFSHKIEFKVRNGASSIKEMALKIYWESNARTAILVRKGDIDDICNAFFKAAVVPMYNMGDLFEQQKTRTSLATDYTRMASTPTKPGPPKCCLSAYCHPC
ncbi:unnamed protein product [Taenia asiatica]|uniref:Major sperm protein n=1 Tax=Taenia asiatica TaxID=60517 RepID=A0A0R3WGZ6_TAEAS|nr:unnamed protein product [Taenia asiatica]